MSSHFRSAFALALGLAAALPTCIAIEAPAPYRTTLPALASARSGAAGYADVYVETNAYGYVTHAEVKATSHPELGEACVAAILEWRYSPARENGQPVPAQFIQPFHFENGRAVPTPKAKADQRPAARHTPRPELPAELRNVPGCVTVLFDVDAEGRVRSVAAQDVSLPALEAPTLAAAKEWTFRPARKRGQPTPAKVAVSFVFK
ncbi:MAG: TonB family protein [Opitutaceae bacterium]|nr:TonB family protein [Opitutaceae bacterium]